MDWKEEKENENLEICFKKIRKITCNEKVYLA